MGNTGSISEKTAAVKYNLPAKYAGFTEHSYRLLFNYEERFSTAPTLQTIMPSGIVENEKKLEPKAEKGLLAYAFPQTIPESIALSNVDKSVVWKREDGTYALVQTWPTTYNQKFRDSYEIRETNPFPTKFVPQAAEEFHKAMVSMFGEEAKNHSVKFCRKATVNRKPVFIGDADQLQEFLRISPYAKQDLGIADLMPNGFVTKVVDGKGNESTKNFTFPTPGASESYALYTKVGWETMACIKPIDQFLAECELHGDDLFAEEREKALATDSSVIGCAPAACLPTDCRDNLPCPPCTVPPAIGMPPRFVQIVTEEEQYSL